ncbi:FAD-binding oxidoreductase [Spiribacter sp. SSL99]|uniref:FAD-binding oxidoreductase n=1 Tax=Spiribacter sp. SSL99 TaxID=1866884 RepID=UPI00132FF990|nr:FAD-binding oxidoreductase [Spiribacter sp. SSL99]
MTMIETLRQQLGDAAVIAPGPAMAGYLEERRGLFAQRPAQAVVRPADTRGVATCVRIAAEYGAGIVPQGGNTGLCGGAATTHPDGLILSLERLDRIRAVDADNFTLTAEAGCTLSALHTAAADVGRLFPLSYAAENDCQIGGNLATNAGGMNVLRYGNARDLALGLEVVLADGRIWDGLRTLRKDNSGYDLKDLFIGAEGTLGIITAASLKLFPAVRERATAIVGLDSATAAVSLFARLRAASGDTITSCELMGRGPLSLALEHAADCHEPLPERFPWYLLVELTSSAPAALDSRLEQALQADDAGAGDYRIAPDAATAADFWRLRNSIPGAQKGAGASIKNDVSVPVADIPAFIEAASAAVTEACPGVRPCAFGHIGDGNIHFNLTRPVATSDEAFLAQWGALTRRVHDIAMQYRGSFAAEHGVGQLKPGEVARLKSPVEQDLMRQLKAAFDPADRLNPGKVVPPSG